MRIISQIISAPFYGLLSTIALAQPVITPPPVLGNPTLGTLPTYNDASANWKNAGLLKIGGIPVRNTQCGATVNPSGVTPPSAVPKDDFHNITDAIAACPTGQVVQLGTGTFQIAKSQLPIFVTKSITIRGTGTCTNAGSTASSSVQFCQSIVNTYNGIQPTYVTSANGNCGVTIGSVSDCGVTDVVFWVGTQTAFNFGWSGCQAGGTVNPTTSNCGTTLAADVAKGATTVQVADNSSFPVPGWVLIDEDPKVVSTANPVGNGQANVNASSDFLSSSGSPVTMRLEGGDLSCSYSFCDNRVNQELHYVTSKGSPCPGVNCTLTFDDPLTMAFRQSGSHDARVYWPTAAFSTTPVPFLDQVGIENLGIQRATRGGIYIQFCSDCWVKNVEVGGWAFGAVTVWYSARAQITGSYFHDCYLCTNNGAEYPIGIDTASTEILVDNNINVRGGKGMVGRAGPAAVIAYNYIDMTFYQITSLGNYFVEMGLNGSHYAGTHHWLLEGNWAPNCDGDETHGNNIYQTFFRNHCTGIRTAFTDPSSVPSGCSALTVDDKNGTGWSGTCPTPTATGPNPLRAAGPMGLNYWHAFVGNVLGLSTVTTGGNGWAYNRTTSQEGTNIPNKSIWLSGWVAGEWNYWTDPNLDGRSNTWIHRHGNYDYVTPGINDWNASYSRALPNSYYLASRPSYFGPSGTNCIYAWPGVTPNETSVLKTPTGAGCTATDWLPAKARFAAGTPFGQP